MNKKKNIKKGTITARLAGSWTFKDAIDKTIKIKEN